MIISKVAKGLTHPNRAVQHLAKKPFIFIDQLFNYGLPVFDREWDLLVVLDACRYDLFVEFAPKHSVYERFDSIESVYSIASQSVDWLERNFEHADDSLLGRTVYITDPSHAAMVTTDKLYDVVEVRESPNNTHGGVLRPAAIADEAVRQFRTATADKYIVHYIQPHAPFLHCVGKYNSALDGEGHPLNVWNGIRDGRFDREEVWEDYGQNLLLVLDHVERLIERFEGTIVVTSDHGNGLGEFGLYGHPGREAAPSIRRVPWATATGAGAGDNDI